LSGLTNSNYTRQIHTQPAAGSSSNPLEFADIKASCLTNSRGRITSKTSLKNRLFK